MTTVKMIQQRGGVADSAGGDVQVRPTSQHFDEPPASLVVAVRTANPNNSTCPRHHDPNTD
jgi:hypothetical protein